MPNIINFLRQPAASQKHNAFWITSSFLILHVNYLYDDVESLEKWYTLANGTQQEI